MLLKLAEFEIYVLCCNLIAFNLFSMDLAVFSGTAVEVRVHLINLLVEPCIKVSVSLDSLL